MRLKSVKRLAVLSPDASSTIVSLTVGFQEAGVETVISILPPENWDTLNRAEKLAWVKQAVITHLLDNIYGGDENEIFPDRIAQEAAADQFEQLPGWATWTTSEAEAFIRVSVFNGNDLATVQSQIDALPANIAGMKTGLKNAADAIIQLRSNQEKIVKAIVLLRDRTIER